MSHKNYSHIDLEKLDRREIEDAAMLYEIKKNQILMIKEWGYEPPEEESLFLDQYDPLSSDEDAALSIFNFCLSRHVGGKKHSIRTNQRLYLYTGYRKEEGGKIYSAQVFYLTPSVETSSSITIKDLIFSSKVRKECYEESIRNDNIQFRLLYIYSAPVGHQCINEIKKSQFHYNLVREDTFCYNPLSHVFSPKIRILDSEEREKVLQELNVEEKSLPKILHSDISAIRVGAMRRDIIEITEDCLFLETHNRYNICYRLVV